ncbi:Zinc finger protein [Nesidiocoris tenuis]|nr:Zinc finger protein [Nesidiocoris tenuis]
MIEHYMDTHGVILEEELLEFEDQDRFMSWKEGTEQLEVCQFTCRSGPHDRREYVIRYYRCFRDGFFKRKSKGLRRVKVKGSIKINGICPAVIKTETNKTTGVVRVTYVRTHVGHSRELGLLTLSKSERAEIARNLAMGIPQKTILDHARESMKSGEVRRSHLTTPKDIWNIRQSFNLPRTERISSINGNDSTNDDETCVEVMLEDPDVFAFDEPESAILADETSVEVSGDETITFVVEDPTHGRIVICVNKENTNTLEYLINEELSKRQSQLNEKKMKIRRKVEELLENVENDEQAEIFLKALLPIGRSIQAHSFHSENTI